jgi:glycolate oxidase iron-sulfur subunit
METDAAPASSGSGAVVLHVLDDELASCVSCGLCLPYCPTYRVTQEEAFSPRGRIAAMKAVQWEGAPADDDFVSFMDACIQCRGCETACPSGVPFGRLMEGTREALAEAGRFTPWWQRLGFSMLGHHRALLAGSTVLAIAQRARLVPRRLGLPRLPVRRPRLDVASSPGSDGVWLFTGCVMDAWQREVHVAASRVLGATGRVVAVAGRRGCCGALHVHAGLTPAARALAHDVMASMPGEAPILVDSAGCGAQLKDYGHLLGTAEAAAFSARVRDVSEWLAAHLDELPPVRRRDLRIAVQDPCHLRHVQRAHLPVRDVLRGVGELVELDDEGLCCGAGGAYSVLHPALANDIRARKLASIERAGADVVASSNPGCAMHLAAAGVAVRHPVELLAEAL